MTESMIKFYPLDIVLCIIVLIFAVWINEEFLKIVSTIMGIIGIIMMFRYLKWIRGEIQ